MRFCWLTANVSLSAEIPFGSVRSVLVPSSKARSP